MPLVGKTLDSAKAIAYTQWYVVSYISNKYDMQARG